MRVRAIFTDLDGTLLEPDGTVTAEALAALGELRRARIPVCAVTSKTVPELEALAALLGLDAPAGFENGAGVWWPDGRVELQPTAVEVGELTAVAAALCRGTGIALRTIFELEDDELSALTGLRGEALAAARRRRATLPLVVAPSYDRALSDALPPGGSVRLLRGNRFLHLQGRHDKADVVPRLSDAAAHGEGATVACGDAPNDLGLLAAADVRIIVPSVDGPARALVDRFPAAMVAPLPHGRGWAAALRVVTGQA